MNKWILFISRRSDQEDQRGSFVHQGSISGGETEWKCMPGMLSMHPGCFQHILYNEQYTGVLIQGKCICVSPGLGKMKQMNEEDWFRTEDHHEPLVSREEFDRVMEMKKATKTGEKKKPRERQDYYFRSILRCKNCGRLLAHQGNRYSCIMGRQSEFSGCLSESYDEEELKERVWEIIREKQAQAP